MRNDYPYLKNENFIKQINRTPVASEYIKIIILN
jgi:hypothetical protein